MWEYTSVIWLNRKLGLRFLISSYWNVVDLPYLTKRNAPVHFCVQHNMKTSASQNEEHCCGRGRDSKLLNLQTCWAEHTCLLCSTLQSYIKPSIWQASITKPENNSSDASFWSDNPICEIFFATVRGDIFGPKLTFCCFCAAVPRHQLSVKEWSTGSCEGFSPQRSKYPATRALYRTVLLIKKYVSARNLHKNITEDYLKGRKTIRNPPPF